MRLLSKRKRSLVVVIWSAHASARTTLSTTTSANTNTAARALPATAIGTFDRNQDFPQLVATAESGGGCRRRHRRLRYSPRNAVVPPWENRRSQSHTPLVQPCANNHQDNGRRPPYPSHSAWLQFDSDSPAESSIPTLRRNPVHASNADPDERTERDEDSHRFSPPDSAGLGENQDGRGDAFPPSRFQQRQHGVSSPAPPLSSSFFPSSAASASALAQQQRQQQPHSPLLYRYYGKSRSRTPGSGSLPFVLFGPNVDHFKLIGQELASRGFSVIACERVHPEDGENKHDASPSSRGPTQPKPPSPHRQSQQQQEPRQLPRYLEDGAVLMEELLDALKWNRVVLVGCDSEAALTVQAAIRLAPSGRVAGLVLCGDLATLQDEILQSGWDITVDGIRSTNRLLIDNFVVDLFLRENVQCPFTVVWAGDAPSLLPNVGAHALAPPELDAVEAMLGNRYVILGGGAAPHRRRPELFAWVLTRFVEEKIADTADARSLQQRQQPVLSKRGGQQDSPYGDDSSSNPNAAPEPRPLNRLVRLQEFFSPGSFLVTGRVVATMIFYWAIMKVGIHQFDNICAGMVNVQSAVKHVQNWRATTFRFVGRLLSKIGGLFLITSYSSTTKATSSSSASSTLSEPKDADSSGIPESDGALGGPNGTNSSVITSAGDADPRNPTPESSSASPDDASLSPPIADESDEDPRRGESDASAPEREKERRKPLFFLDHVVA